MTSRRPSPKPSSAVAAAALTCVCLGACTQATSPSPTLTVKGTVVDTTSGTPVSGATVLVFGVPGVAPAKTDAAGTYALSGIASDTVVTLWAQASDRVQPCSTRVLVNQNTTVELHLILNEAIAVFNASTAARVAGTRTVTGTVVNGDSSGKPPVAGAAVAISVSSGPAIAQANTVTDAAGRYLLCGVPKSQDLGIRAEVPGKSGLGFINPGTDDATVNIEISVLGIERR